MRKIVFWTASALIGQRVVDGGAPSPIFEEHGKAGPKYEKQWPASQLREMPSIVPSFMAGEPKAEEPMAEDEELLRPVLHADEYREKAWWRHKEESDRLKKRLAAIRSEGKSDPSSSPYPAYDSRSPLYPGKGPAHITTYDQMEAIIAKNKKAREEAFAKKGWKMPDTGRHWQQGQYRPIVSRRPSYLGY